MAAINDLPVEILAHIASLIPPSYHPSGSSNIEGSRQDVLDIIDPLPKPPHTEINDISAFSKCSHRTLQAARPWLWENVDVVSGRGWLAIVNALTEEVIETTEVPSQAAGNADMPLSAEGMTASASEPLPISPEQAHYQPQTLDGALARYTYTPSDISPYTTGIASSSSAPHLNNSTSAFPSSPQPDKAALLLTPPHSRNSSPHIPSSSTVPSVPTITTTAEVTSKTLRGRSKSPRRSLGLASEGISAVLDRSRSPRSLSLHRTASSRSVSTGPRRVPLERRRSSLSRVRTLADNAMDDRHDENEEEDDDVGPLPERGRSRRPPTPPASPPIHLEEDEDEEEVKGMDEDEEEDEEDADELLPPPGPYIRHLTFNKFRTIGSRRTQEEAVRGRFVTAGRLEGVIKNAPNLRSLCMTEYVDSSLSLPVLEELLFRGYNRPRKLRKASVSRGRSLSIDPNPIVHETPSTQLDPPRPVYAPYESETEEQKWRRRAMFTPIEALDLTGCVSSVFNQAITELWETWYAPAYLEVGEVRGRGRTRRRDSDDLSTAEESEDDAQWNHGRQVLSRRTPKFYGMKRFSLRACTLVPPPIIQDITLSFPNLTHLDLSNTRVPSTLLRTLTDRPPRTLRLQSLSLSKCARLSPSDIVNFLIHSACVKDLMELNLYMNPTQSNSIGPLDMERLITSAPCFKSGSLRYLDLSGSGLLPQHLEMFAPQPSLISLGLSHLPTMPLLPIQEFLAKTAPNVEVLTLTGTAFDSSLSPTISPLQMTLELHARLINPLTTIPFSLSSLSLSTQSKGPDLRPGPSKLRVVELSSGIRRDIADGASSEWHVIRSKGGRGWYVDLSAGWIDRDDPYYQRIQEQSPLKGEPLSDEDQKSLVLERQFARHLPPSHPRRAWLTHLAQASGRVGSAVGWHSRKMEIVRGMGMMCREEGMAGVGGFAFEE